MTDIKVAEHVDLPAVRAVSVLGGRPHLIKAEAVHRAFVRARTRHEHATIDCRLAERNDYPYPGSADFGLPDPSVVIRDADGSVLARKLEAAFRQIKPDVVIVYGDVPVTDIAQRLATKRSLPTIHVESGYRSGDPNDDEEKTRLLVDHLATHHVAYSSTMMQNLLNENIPGKSISQYADPALVALTRRLHRMTGDEAGLLTVPTAGLVTFHHDENLATHARASLVLRRIGEVAEHYDLTLILYAHTVARLRALGLVDKLRSLPIKVFAPTSSYDAYIKLLLASAFVITDSSGLQDDAAFIGRPCFVMRASTPRREKLGSVVRLVDIETESLVTLARAAVAQGIPSTSEFPASLPHEFDASFIKIIELLAGS